MPALGCRAAIDRGAELRLRMRDRVRRGHLDSKMITHRVLSHWVRIRAFIKQGVLQGVPNPKAITPGFGAQVGSAAPQELALGVLCSSRLSIEPVLRKLSEFSIGVILLLQCLFEQTRRIV